MPARGSFLARDGQRIVARRAQRTRGAEVVDLAAQRLTSAGYSRARLSRPANAATATPSVSVVIPSYNYGAYLPACVASVLGQEGVDLEVLIVDDRSTDGSGAVAESLATAD